MNKKVLIVIGVIVLLAILGGMAWLFARSTPPTNTPNGGVTFPLGGTSTSTQTTGSIQATDILHSEGVVEDPENPGTYYFGTNPITDPNPPYVIAYIEASKFFNISLTQEPIGENRRAAEAYLRTKLGLTNEQMCNINYSVGVPYSVNSQYSSISLGFSFCPGAVRLP